MLLDLQAQHFFFNKKKCVKVKIGDGILLKNILNLVMTLFLLLIMDYHFIGNELHETCGAVFCLLLIFHNMLNRHWYGFSLNDAQNLRRMLMMLVNFFLASLMVTVFVTGMLISLTLFAPLGIRSDSLFIHDLHQGAAYASFILAAVHLGLHWRMLSTKFKKWLPIDDSSFGWIIAKRSASIVVITYGIYASFVHHIGANLLMQHSFGGWGTEPSLWFFLLDYFAILGGYIGITHYLWSL